MIDPKDTLAAPPVVDLSDFEERRHEICQQLLDAAANIGIPQLHLAHRLFYVAGHGVPEEIISGAFAGTERFYNMPAQVKASLPRANWGAGSKLYGYEDNEMADGTVRESYSHLYDHHEEMKTTWPGEEACPGYRQQVTTFMQAMDPVAKKIVSCFATILGLPADHFEQTMNVSSPDNYTFAQFHKYPSTEGHTWDPSVPRIFAHTDESIITLLHTSAAPAWQSSHAGLLHLFDPSTPSQIVQCSVGLEVAAGRDGKAVVGQENGQYLVDNWRPCPNKPGCIVCNVGDPLQMMSDGLFASNYHRVRMPRQGEPQGTRYSCAYFVWPNINDEINGQKDTTPATTMGDYMREKGKLFQDKVDLDGAAYGALSLDGHAIGLPQMQQTAAVSA